MDDSLRELVLGVAATGLGAAIGWSFRAFLWRRALRRKQRFFGLPDHSESVLVVNRDPAAEGAVARGDVFALLEVTSLIKDCGAQLRVLTAHDARQGFGERTEFCIGGPVSNPRTAAHLEALLPGVHIQAGPHREPGHGTYTIGGESHRPRKGAVEYVLLARLAPEADMRPVFLICGQTSVSNQAAARHLARHHKRLARKHGGTGTFCLLLKVVSSAAYGPDVVEVVGDVTRAALTPAPAPAGQDGTEDGDVAEGSAQDSAASA
ncbi:hypothetical protein GCM10023347_28230 [Streptomyces chumphonensis]|uniref:Secreted protein n=1 Tax=Streptomyces chumphonensis TaxID=1214925 RepID=A0A927IBX0_9ACTN|nr:hypothetical protein [Streptomyces chumphonensis]MBD3931305.1 hypothetical protein [Streptomyces chumphonensis]